MSLTDWIVPALLALTVCQALLCAALAGKLKSRAVIRDAMQDMLDLQAQQLIELQRQHDDLQARFRLRCGNS